MQTMQYIWTRRLLAGVIFSMVLVLTPRAWVDQGSARSASEDVPVQTLEQPTDCLWCEPSPSREDCTEEGSDEKPRMWLHPDEPMPSVEQPCKDADVETSPSA